MGSRGGLATFQRRPVERIRRHAFQREGRELLAPTQHLHGVRELLDGAGVVVDYKTEDFENRLHGYDVVLHSQDADTLDKSLRVLKPGGQLVSISGPPDPDFARAIGAPWFVKAVIGLLSWGTRRKVKRIGRRFSFLFMRADGSQLRKIGALIESGAIRPTVDRIFPFEAANEALAYLETGRAKGKVVVKVR